MEELIKIQSELKAPKNQRNTFGKYNYRSCEDILEAVKPLLLKYGCLLTLEDDASFGSWFLLIPRQAAFISCRGLSSLRIW